jgi:hypothetical protein
MKSRSTKTNPDSINRFYQELKIRLALWKIGAVGQIRNYADEKQKAETRSKRGSEIRHCVSQNLAR